MFPTFVDYYKKRGITDKFIGITNGVTPRRWMAQCNPELSAIITKCLGTDKWIRDLSLLDGLKKFADDDKVSSEFLSNVSYFLSCFLSVLTYIHVMIRFWRNWQRRSSPTKSDWLNM